MVHRRPIQALALSLALLVAACGGGGGSGTDDSPAGQVRAMLRQRATLLVKGDVDGYLEAVAPAAMATERPIAEGAAAVPLSYANVSFHPQGAGKSTATRFDDADVEVVVRYEGLPPENLFRFRLRYDLERRGSTWAITESSFGDDEVPPPLWTTGAVESRRTEHFLALYRPGLAVVDAALAAAETARDGLAERLENLESDPVHLVVLAASEEEYNGLSGEETSPSEVAAAVFLFRSISRPEERHMIVKAHRLVEVGASSVSDDGAELPATLVFQHELAHLALTRHDGPYTPGWVNEGAAMYLAGERRVDTWRVAMNEGLFDDVSIQAVADEEGLADSLEYAYANAAVLYLVEEFGAERFFEFYTAFRPLLPSAEFDQGPTDATLLQRYDMTTSQLDEKTRAYIERALAAG